MDGRPSGRARTGAAVALAALLLAPAALLLSPPPAAGQGAEEELGGPPQAGAPDQFRVSLTGSHVDWEAPERSDGQEIEEATAWGLDVETRVASFLAFRFGGAFGTTEIAGADGEGTRRRVDANQWLLELVAEPRLAAGPLLEAGVVPFGVAGLGSVVHDPKTGEGEFQPPLLTRSQGALIYGGGVEVEPDALGAFGARLEFRRAEVQLQNLLVSTDREGTGRHRSRFMASVYLAF